MPYLVKLFHLKILKSIPEINKLGPTIMEEVISLFEQRIEYQQNDVIIKQGEKIKSLYIIKNGEVAVLQNGKYVRDHVAIKNFAVKEASGYSYVGFQCIKEICTSKYEVQVYSERAQVVKLDRRQGLFNGKRIFMFNTRIKLNKLAEV